MARSPLPLRNLHPDSVKIFEEIGKGGFSRVFAAEVSSYGQVLRAAAKKVRASILVDEVATIRQLDHRNIIKFYGVYKNAEDDAFIVMELAERKDLRHMLNNYRRGKVSPIRLPEELVKKWIVEAAHALQYLHSMHYIHRDIKSLNFLVMMNFSLKLGDLGLSKELVGTAKTKGGGTCQWMAPEVISKQFRSPKSDVFSYGIVVWEIVTTDIPHKEIKGEYSIMQAVCKDGKRPEIPDDCPPKVAEIMRGCWSHDHSKRPTMGDICKVYEQCNVNFDYIPDEALFQDKQTMGPPLAPGAAAAVHGTQDSMMDITTRLFSSQDVDMLSQPSREEMTDPQHHSAEDTLDSSQHTAGHPTTQAASLQTLQPYSTIQSQTSPTEGFSALQASHYHAAPPFAHQSLLGHSPGNSPGYSQGNSPGHSIGYSPGHRPGHSPGPLASHPSSVNPHLSQYPTSPAVPIQDTAGPSSFGGAHQHLQRQTSPEAAAGYGFSPLDSRDQQPRNIPERSIEVILSDKFLLDLAKEFGADWFQFGIFLGFTLQETERFQQENSTLTQRCMKMMVKWRQKQDRSQGTGYVIDKLCEALAECERHDLVNTVRQQQN